MTPVTAPLLGLDVEPAGPATNSVDRAAPTVLRDGAHKSPGHGLSLLEAVAWVAGEPHDDRPQCCCPVLAAFGREWNDRLRSDTERDQLLTYINRLISTRSDQTVEDQRREQALWWLIREWAPVWLNLAGMDGHAATLQTMQQLDPRAFNAATADAQAAAADVTGYVIPVVRIALVTALRATAGTAAWDAVCQTPTKRVVKQTQQCVNNVLAVAYAAAQTAAAAHVALVKPPDEHWAALQSEAVSGTLEPTVQTLQTSAHRLFDQMINAAS